ncbi:PIN domain-containing protein [Candidatus Gottesmanbacteria bacterium]|nr:PIN domain-containing protein [Candidatus Gottesmanbacteria bacterium]
MIFVDTNYFVWFLMGDESQHQEIAARLFEDGLSGKVKLYMSIIVFFEIYWVLKSKYKLSKETLINSLKNVLDMSFIKLDERECLYKSLDVYNQTNLDLEDSYTLALVKSDKDNNLATFDEELLKMFKKSK